MPIVPDPVPTQLTFNSRRLGLFDPAYFDPAFFDPGSPDPMPVATGSLTITLSSVPGGLTLTEE